MGVRCLRGRGAGSGVLGRPRTGGSARDWSDSRAIAAFGWAGFGALNWLAGSPGHQIVRERAQAGQLEVRVLERAVVVDTVWELRVRQPAGLLSKEWSAGCLNGDNPDDSFESVKWVGATRLEVLVADGRVLHVDLDPATGRPIGPVTTGVGC